MTVKRKALLVLVLLVVAAGMLSAQVKWERTEKPQLHGKHWMAITGKPLGATAGAMIFAQGGNAVDATCAMLAVVCNMVDALTWGGETQALIYNPNTKKVYGINALGVAPTGATADFFMEKGMVYPPDTGPLAAVTPGTPGGLMTMLAEYGTMSLAQVLAPAIEMAANGYAVEAQAANAWEGSKKTLAQWPYSRKVFLPHYDGNESHRWAPYPGEVWKQPDLANTLQKLVATEKSALMAGKSRKEAIYAAYDRFYKGDIAKEYCRGSQEQGGLHQPQDLANWKVYIEEPIMTTYRGVEVYKLTTWTQGPTLLQALNILENFDLKAMGFNTPEYIHTLYQAMSLAFADRDFYYGDPYFPPEEPIKGLLSKEYARDRARLIRMDQNDPTIKPGDLYPYQGGVNPFKDLLDMWSNTSSADPHEWQKGTPDQLKAWNDEFYMGTTSIQASDDKGWVVSVTPSGGWNPACIAGNTGIGMSQRMQSFVADETLNPYNVVQPGMRPRCTLTPSMALKDGKPLYSFAVQGGDTQEQNMLMWFLNVLEWGATAQQAAEGPNFTSFQMSSSFGSHISEPGRILLDVKTPKTVAQQLVKMGYKVEFAARNSGPLNTIVLDREHGTFWGGSSNNGEDYGIAW